MFWNDLLSVFTDIILSPSRDLCILTNFSLRLSGTIMSMPWPVVLPRPAGSPPLGTVDDLNPQEYRIHAHCKAGITSMVLLQDKGLLFTAK